MSALTETQRKYILNELSREYNKAVRQLREDCTVVERLLPPKEIIDALDKGEFTLRNIEYERWYHFSIRDFICFNNDVRGSFDSATYEKGREKLLARFVELERTIILGETQLDMLTDFTEFCKSFIK